MTKVVINTCHGGFGLNPDAEARYWEIKGGEKPEGWYDDLIARDDPALVQVVEEMGPRGSGAGYSYLEIQDVPPGTIYRISEYDGLEHIETRDGIEWLTA